MSSVAPAAEPAAPARTSGLAAIFEHTRYVLGENCCRHRLRVRAVDQ